MDRNALTVDERRGIVGLASKYAKLPVDIHLGHVSMLLGYQIKLLASIDERLQKMSEPK